MNSKNNRHNHDFQIANFLAGRCHTTDGAYAILCDLKEDRELALGSAHAASYKQEARLRMAKYLKRAFFWFPPIRLYADGVLMEAEAFRKSSQACYEAAVAELAFIEKCIERVQPHRKHKDLPDPEAHEAAQREEWRLELMFRAENEIIASGRLTSETLGTIRCHPDQLEMLPAIEGIQKFKLLDRPKVTGLLE